MTPREDDSSEEDVAEDDHVAASRAGKKGEDGTYVGRTSSDDAIDAGETGAEARSDDGR
ncbi:hypothetical protein QGN32_24130 [Mycolicibacterium sp. ND9-15]|uniref:hypothetical protein n=1 Tax=Mycolicibacterium sp. ND9-15 TaxID=3042320 RepID=UPI002DD8838E|nr:hypothetical protein [Mycolicibacterium sp. ND9-15]WSE56371.1 hypothetical protein QGN32_24130 [Mycolicibacterium sp. ND9-15]